MERKKLSIILLVLILLTFANPINVFAKDQDTKTVEKIEIQDKYSNINDIPTTIEYVDGTYKGTLSLIDRKVISGEASQEKIYSNSFNFTIFDYCNWNAYNSTMIFNENKVKKEFPSEKQTIEKDNIIFETKLQQCDETGVFYTKYAIPGYVQRKLGDEAFIGFDYLVDGEEYITAHHYFAGTYYGTYYTLDTQKYIGIYSGVLNDTEAITLQCEVLKVADPTKDFRSGDKGILKIKTTNNVEKIKIIFPTELSELNNNLNTEITLEPKAEDEVQYEFFVPLNAGNKTYNIQVTATKSTPFREKVRYPYFNVTGSILDNLRTRIK